MAELLQRELTLIVAAHLLALIPIGALLIAGRMSPLYHVPTRQLARWWAWFALVIVVMAFLESAVTSGRGPT
jgi:hypothetical protein